MISGTLARRTRRLARLAPALLVLALTAGCGAGFDSATDLVTEPGQGSSGDAGDIAVRNLLLFQDEADPPATTLSVALINQGTTDDRLTQVTVVGTPAVQPDLDLSAQSIVVVGNGNETEITVPGVPAGLGFNATVTLQFEQGGAVTLDALVTTPENAAAGG